MTSIYVKADTVLPERHANDLYVTERNLIHAAMQRYAPAIAHSILDVGAGDGRWGQIAYRYSREVRHVDGVEIEPVPQPSVFTGWYNEDFMTWQAPRTYDWVVSNPPYFLAEPIIRKCWDILNPGGAMIMLLRLAFMEGVDRYNSLWDELYPMEVSVLSRRPSFYGAGRTNGTAFGLFYWEKGEDGHPRGMGPRTWVTSLLLHERDGKERTA